MPPEPFLQKSAVRNHYDAFLAGRYAWIAGGETDQIRKNSDFFRDRGVIPGDGRIAVDLGAGCGFQAIPLARGGFMVKAVDFCETILQELRQRAGSLPIVTAASDIQNYSSWGGMHPALIVCMGDTLTHLPSMDDARDLIRQCFSELDHGGKLVLSFRDYSRQPAGEIAVIPVRRGEAGIFLCRLEFLRDTVTVQDIMYTFGNGTWSRESGKYIKIRIDQDVLCDILTTAGFEIEYRSSEAGMVSIIAKKDH